MTGNEAIPFAEMYRGVGIHNGQNLARMDIVRAWIDTVLAERSSPALAALAADVTCPPEARVLAAAKVEAAFNIAASERRERPDIDLDLLRASVAGLNSLRWQSPFAYCSLLDHLPSPGGRNPVQRETPLAIQEG